MTRARDIANIIKDANFSGTLDVTGATSLASVNVSGAIVSSSNGNIAITPNGSGKVILDGLSHPTADGSANQFLKTDGSGNLSFAAVSGTTINSNADNRIISGSGTANTLNGEANLTFNGTTLALTGNQTVSGTLGVTGAVTGTLATAAQPNVTSVGTLASFRSTGIDDNADALAITIDSSENVGIGISLPSPYDDGGDKLVIGKTNARSGMTIVSSTSTAGSLHFADGTGTASYRGILAYYHDNDSMRFSTSATERMRIDSSGNVLVGQTAQNLATAGVSLNSAGYVQATTDSVALYANRTGSNGNIINLYKNNALVGTIGTNGELGIGDEDVGIYFSPSTDSIIPCNPASGYVNRGSAIDLGYSSVPFQDIYLSGGVFVGGTGSANKLDDYEEGTAFGDISDASGDTYNFYEQNGQYNRITYTKIGRLVYFSIRFYTSSTGSATGGDQARITGLPFAAINGQPTGGARFQVSYSDANTSNALVMGGIIPDNSTIIMLNKQDLDGTYSNLTISELGAFHGDVMGMYHTG